MAQYATHLAGLDDEDYRRLEARSLELLGDEPPVLERAVLFIAAVV